MKRKRNAVTLFELIIALSIFSLMFLAFASIQLFSRFQFLNSSRRSVLQNEVMYVLEHMARHITGTNAQGGAIGIAGGINPPDGTGIWVLVDDDQDGVGNLGKEIAYVYDSGSRKILFYGDWIPLKLGMEALTQGRILGDLSSNSDKDTYILFNSNLNYLDVQITARWDPSKDVSRENPQVVMRSRIKMPGISTPW